MEIFANRLARGANFDALQVFLQEWCREQSVQELYDAAQRRMRPVRARVDHGRPPRLAPPRGALGSSSRSRTPSPAR
jgi:hypothetical protein